MSMNELFTAQVAERMKVSLHIVRWWCRHGLLPNAQEVNESRGAVWKIPQGDLDEFIPPQKTGGPPQPITAAKRVKAAANASKGHSNKKGGKK